MNDIQHAHALGVARLAELFDRERVDVEPARLGDEMDDGEARRERVRGLDGGFPERGVDCGGCRWCSTVVSDATRADPPGQLT